MSRRSNQNAESCVRTFILCRGCPIPARNRRRKCDRWRRSASVVAGVEDVANLAAPEQWQADGRSREQGRTRALVVALPNERLDRIARFRRGRHAEHRGSARDPENAGACARPSSRRCGPVRSRSVSALRSRLRGPRADPQFAALDVDLHEGAAAGDGGADRLAAPASSSDVRSEGSAQHAVLDACLELHAALAGQA